MPSRPEFAHGFANIFAPAPDLPIRGKSVLLKTRSFILRGTGMAKKSKTKKLKSKPQLKKTTKAKPKTTVPVPPQPSDVPKP